MTDPVDPIAVAIAVGRVRDALDIPYTVGGSIVSSVAGEPRSTVDIDIVAAFDESHVPALVAAFDADFYVDAADGGAQGVRAAGHERLVAQAFRPAATRW